MQNLDAIGAVFSLRSASFPSASPQNQVDSRVRVYRAAELANCQRRCAILKRLLHLPWPVHMTVWSRSQPVHSCPCMAAPHTLIIKNGRV